MTAYISYSVSRVRAEAIARPYAKSISPLRGQLILFIDNQFNPCWLFRAKYNEALTGATFDVYMSIFGTQIKSKKKLAGQTAGAGLGAPVKTGER